MTTLFELFVFVLVMLALQRDARIGRESRSGDYSRDALISVTPNNVADENYLLCLAKRRIVNLWNEDRIVIGEKKLMRVNRCWLNYIKRIFEKRNIKVTVVDSNLQRLINRNSKPAAYTIAGNRNYAKNFDFGQYHSFEIIELFLKGLTKEYKDISKLEQIGKSYEKRPLYAVKISLGTGKKFSKQRKRTIVIECGMHAREWASISFCLYFTHALLTGYKRNDKVFKNVLEKYDFIILPVINPDGYVYSKTKDRLWRKTRSKIEGSRCLGVDGNRNFYRSGDCHDRDPCEETYCGKKPFSEPEVISLKRLLENTKGNLAAYFAIHTYGQYWLMPWAKKANNRPMHHEEMMKVANTGVNALKKRFNTKYKFGMVSTILYPAVGSILDYVYENRYANYSFGLELRDKGDCGRLQECGFLLPTNKIIPTCQETTDGILAAISAIK